MVESLSKGKALVVILVASLVALGVALFIYPGILASLMFAFAASFFVLFLIIFVTWAKKSVGIEKGNFHYLSQAVKSIERKQKAHSECVVYQSKAMESRLSNIEQLLRQMTARSTPAQCKTDDSSKFQAESDRGNTPSLYTPGFLPSSKVIKSNSSGVIGRRAASIETEAATVPNLDVILNSDKERWKKNIATIVRSDVENKLSDKYNVLPLSPNRVSGVLEENLDYILIDERCSRTGRWAGFLETFKLGTYLELANALTNAKKRDVVVLVVEDSVSSSLTNSIREFADIRLNLSSLKHSDHFASLEFYQDVRGLVSLEERAHV